MADSLRLLRRIQTLEPQGSSSTLVTPTITFDPRGRYLSSSDPSNLRTAIIWKMGLLRSEVHRKLLHPVARLGSGGFNAWDELKLVVWSHSGDQLLTQSSATIAVWDPNVCKSFLTSHYPTNANQTGGSLMEFDPIRILSGGFRTHSDAIVAARWMPNDQAVIFGLGAEVHIVVRNLLIPYFLLSVANSRDIVRLLKTLGGIIEWSHAFQNLSVYDLSIGHLENSRL